MIRRAYKGTQTRFAYSAPAPKRNITAQRAFRIHTMPEYPDPRVRHTSMRSWRYDRDLNRPQFPSERIRLALGFIRAFGSTHFFNGSNKGAEND
jgi:hypothetical protein